MSLIELSPSDKLYLQIMDDLHSNWNPHSGQVKVGMPLIKKDVNTLFIQCGRKWGKTDFAIYLLWRHALLHPGSTCYYITPELSHGREIIWHNSRLTQFGREKDGMGRIIPGGKEPLRKYIKHVSNVDSRLTLKNGSTIKIVGSENWAAANGLTPDFVVYDEFKVFHTQFHNEMNPNRIVRKAPLVIIGTPPKSGDRNAEQYLEFAEECSNRSDAFHIIASSYDNPFTPRDEIDREIEKLRLRGEDDVVEREYFGKIAVGGRNAIFPMFDEKQIKPHKELLDAITKDRKKLDWFCITDPGSTTCFAVLLGCINPYTKHLFIMDEIYEVDQENTTVRSIYPRIDAKMAELFPYSSVEDDWCKVYDEAAAWFSTEVMHQYGVYFMPTAKHMNKKEHGLSLIKDQLIHGLVSISDRCKKLKWEIQNYVKDGKGNIPKRNDHLIDCWRYLNAAANYNMVEVLETLKQKNDDNRRYYSMKDDYKALKKHDDWTFNILPWED